MYRVLEVINRGMIGIKRKGMCGQREDDRQRAWSSVDGFGQSLGEKGLVEDLFDRRWWKL